MFEKLFGSKNKIKYGVFVHMITDQIIILKEEFNETLSEEDIVRKILKRKVIRSETGAFYPLTNAMNITIRKLDS